MKAERQIKPGLSRASFAGLITPTPPRPPRHLPGFTHRVFGDALRGEGINHLDRLYCERASELAAGELGIVSTPYGVLARFVTLTQTDAGDFVKLEAANPNTLTLCLSPDDVQIMGRVVTLLRDLRGARREREGES